MVSLSPRRFVAAKGACHGTPIVAMTAHAQRHDRDRCLREGTDDYLSKPVALTQLSRVLMRWAPLPSTEAPASVKADGTGNHGRVLNPAALAQIKAMQDPGEPACSGTWLRAFARPPLRIWHA